MGSRNKDGDQDRDLLIQWLQDLAWPWPHIRAHRPQTFQVCKQEGPLMSSHLAVTLPPSGPHTTVASTRRESPLKITRRGAQARRPPPCVVTSPVSKWRLSSRPALHAQPRRALLS